MENSLELYKSWILKAAREKKLTISKLQWPSKLKLDIFDYAVDVMCNDQTYSGRGSDADEDIAICKATSEAFERFCVRHFKLQNSNGCAAHFDRKIARENAILELIERDCFLYKFIQGEPFKQVDQKFFQFEYPCSTKMYNYLLSSNQYFITLSRITMNDSANIIGLGIASKIQDALKHSELEAIRQWTFLSKQDTSAFADYHNILNRQKFDFETHGDLAMTPEHFNEIAFMFDQSKNVIDTFKNFNFDRTEYREFKPDLPSDHPFFGVPLHFVKAYNPEAQELFVGKTLDHINPHRILTPLAPEKLNLCYHPFR